MRRALVLIVALAACRDDNGSTSAPPAPPTVVTPVDAALAPVDAISFVPGFDPASGMHIDDDDTGGRTGTGGVTPRSRRYVEILLRSTPPGATAVVDGRVIGKTPTYWEGEFTGRERDFAFLLPGHALSRYSFVPTSNGIVHARLTRVTSDGDAGLPEIPLSALERPQPPPPPRRTVDAAPIPSSQLDASPAPQDGEAATTPATIDAGTPRVGPPEP